jgi:hypothetical protein
MDLIVILVAIAVVVYFGYKAFAKKADTDHDGHVSKVEAQAVVEEVKVEAVKVATKAKTAAKTTAAKAKTAVKKATTTAKKATK